MIEPKRLLDGEATEFERQLLCSVVDEAPTSGQRLQMMRGICVVGPVLWTTQVRAAAETVRDSILRITTAAASKGTMGVALLGVAAGGAYFQTRTPTVESSFAGDIVSSTAVSAQVVPVVEKSMPQQVPVLRNTLAQEVILLDRARAALREQQSKLAAAALREYQQRFPEGVLQQEASQLRDKLPAQQ